VQIAGSSVLLTGATGGIGHAIARALRSRGAELTLTGRRSDVLEPLATELGARALVADLSDRVALERLLDDVGDVDILLANAALPASGRLESFSIEEIDRALEVNLRAPIVLARALLPAMLERDRGHLLFVSSLAGKAPAPGACIYNASKAGLRGFAGALRADLHGSGVGVSAVFPGFIRDAGMFADVAVELPPGVGTRTPEDVARAVIAAIERDRGEIDVAPLPLRVGAMFAGLAPELATSVSRRMGSDEIARRFSVEQRDKR
jgi:short-subunit dehydrogenase